MSYVNIEGLPKKRVLAALYNAATVQGMGILHARNGNMTEEEAKKILDEGHTYFDYLYGRVMKVALDSDTEFNDVLYDRDNGQGAAQRVIDGLR